MKKSFRAFQLVTGLICTALLSACAGAPTPAAQTAPTPITLNLQWVTQAQLRSSQSRLTRFFGWLRFNAKTTNRREFTRTYKNSRSFACFAQFALRFSDFEKAVQAQFAGYYVALDKGWYKEEGIDLTIHPGGPDTISINSVRYGSAQFGTSLLADIIVADQKANDLVSIAQIQQTNGLLLIAKKDSGISTPQDFIGKKVGIWLGNWEAQFNALIAKENIKPAEFTLVAQSFSMDDFINGKLDVASAMIYNEYYTVLESGIKPEELNIINYADYGLGFPGDVLFTTSKFAQENPEICAGMVRASLRGWEYAIDHPEEAVDIVLKYDSTGSQKRDHQLAMMNEIAKLVRVNIRPIGYTERADIVNAIDTLYSYKILEKLLEPEIIFTNKFWEQSQNQD